MDRKDLAQQGFPTTDWALLARARSDQPESVGQVLAHYVPAIRRYLRRVRRLDADRAEDVIQGFVLDKIITRPLLERTDRDRGRFRTLLVRALENYLRDMHRRERARQPAVGSVVANEQVLGDLTDPRAADPAKAFEVEWAKAVLAEAAARVHRYCDQSLRPDLWEVFEQRVLAPAADGVKPLGYQDLTARLKLASPVAAAHALGSAKRIFIRKLHEVLLEHAGKGAEAEKELAALRKILAGAART